MWADENSKKLYPCTKNVLTFSKFAIHRNRFELIGTLYKQVTWHHFKGRTAADDVDKSSSRLPRDLVMRWSWSWGSHHFLSFIFGVDTRFVFDFVVFNLWVNSNITCWQSRHTGWFQIPYLCPLSIDQKISLISSAKCLASLIREPICFQLYMGSTKFSFKWIIFSSRRSMQILFTDRALLTLRRMDKILGKVSPVPYIIQILW